MCFNWNADGKSACHLAFRLLFIVICRLLYPALILGERRLYLPHIYTLHHAFTTRSGGGILHAQAYPFQEVDAEEGGGSLIRPYSNFIEYGCTPYVGMAQNEWLTCTTSYVQNSALDVVISLYEPYQSFSSVSSATILLALLETITGVPHQQVAN